MVKFIKNNKRQWYRPGPASQILRNYYKLSLFYC